MNPSLAPRVRIAMYLLLIPLAAILVQLTRFQILPTPDRSALFSVPFPLVRHVETPRGLIYDRNGNLLAGNVTHYRIYLDNCQQYLWAEDLLPADNHGQASISIARVLGELVQVTGAQINIPPVVQSLQELDRSLSKGSANGEHLSTCTLSSDAVGAGDSRVAVPLWLDESQEGKLEIAQGQTADANGHFHNDSLLSDLRSEAWYTRYYPEGSLGSEVIGYSRQSGDQAGNPAQGVLRYYLETGDWGVENYYNDILQGTREDVTWTVVPIDISNNIDRAQPPANLILTIDREIQAESEAVLREGIERSHASRGSILVLRPQTGEILAMADYPAADLNDPGGFETIFHAKGRLPDDPQGQVPSLNSEAPYEPGSTFKVLTMASALDSGKVQPGTTFVDQGSLEVGGLVIHNWTPQAFGLQDMTGCLANSINTCLAWVATQKMGPADFYSYMDRFWIGRTIGVDLPELAGDLRRPGDTDWTDATLATNAFGQGVSVTPLHLAAAIAAVANHGVMMIPHVVKSIVRPDGSVEEINPVRLGQPISAATADTLNKMLAQSLQTEDSKALVPGYQVAGKTGTADIPPYVGTKTIASFVGWGPADDPQVLILIRIDEPTSAGDMQYGSITAAPLFAELAPRVFAVLGIPPDAVRHKLVATQ